MLNFNVCNILNYTMSVFESSTRGGTPGDGPKKNVSFSNERASSSTQEPTYWDHAESSSTESNNEKTRKTKKNDKKSPIEKASQNTQQEPDQSENGRNASSMQLPN